MQDNPYASPNFIDETNNQVTVKPEKSITIDIVEERLKMLETLRNDSQEILKGIPEKNAFSAGKQCGHLVARYKLSKNWVDAYIKESKNKITMYGILIEVYDVIVQIEKMFRDE